MARSRGGPEISAAGPSATARDKSAPDLQRTAYSGRGAESLARPRRNRPQQAAPPVEAEVAIRLEQPPALERDRPQFRIVNETSGFVTGPPSAESSCLVQNALTATAGSTCGRGQLSLSASGAPAGDSCSRTRRLTSAVRERARHGFRVFSGDRYRQSPARRSPPRRALVPPRKDSAGGQPYESATGVIRPRNIGGTIYR